LPKSPWPRGPSAWPTVDPPTVDPALLVLSRIRDWDDVVGNRLAWDTLVYFAALLALAEGLEQLGIVAWAAHGASSLLVGASPILAMIVLVSFFFLIHYFFASLTAHTMAVLPALLAAGIAFPGMPVRPLALLLVYAIGLMGHVRQKSRCCFPRFTSLRAKNFGRTRSAFSGGRGDGSEGIQQVKNAAGLRKRRSFTGFLEFFDHGSCRRRAEDVPSRHFQVNAHK
jgi:Sodium:sulfate symporter transmembrane region